MSAIRQIFQGTSEIDFRPKWRVSLLTSGILLTIALAFVLLRGLSLSIDFEGGAIWKVPVENSEISIAEIRSTSEDLVDARIQEVFDREGNRDEITVQVGTDKLENSVQIRQDLATKVDLSSDDIGEDTIGPTWGDEISSRAFRALIIFFIAVAIYLAWTLEWRMAVAALAAVVHDLLITAGVYSVTGFEVSPATVIALLTILGYSLYDTVVVFDKVKENEVNPLMESVKYPDLVSQSMNQVLMRSINTTITTVLPVLSMLVIGNFFLNAPSLSNFALALFIGLILGTYSSIFLAAPLLVWMHRLDPEVRQHELVEKKRTERAAARKSATSSDSDDDGYKVSNATIQPRARKKPKK